MKYFIFLMINTVLYYNAFGSGCNWDDHSYDGTSMTVLEIRETSRFIFRREDYTFSCKDYGTGDLTSKANPKMTFKALAGECKKIEAVLNLNNGKEVVLVKRNIEFEDYDNCGSSIGPACRR